MFGRERRRSARMTHLCSDRVTHTKNTICPRAREPGPRYHPRRRRAVCLSIIWRRRHKVFGFQDEIPERHENHFKSPGPGPPDLPTGKSLLPAGNPYLFTSGAGSLLASKVGSFLASAEASCWATPRQSGRCWTDCCITATYSSVGRGVGAPRQRPRSDHEIVRGLR